MSISTNAAQQTASRLLSGKPQNLIAQADARHVLQEVKEAVENYPHYDPHLTEKATHIAYALIACGCSIVENNESAETVAEGATLLEKAGKILSDIYKHNPSEEGNTDYNLLIAGMALFSAKQYSRAYIALKDITVDFAVGQIIISFAKKDFVSLITYTNKVFFSTPPIDQDVRVVDEWVISHEIARCFIIALDYIHSGSDTTFSIIDKRLKDLLSIAVDERFTLYWLIIRLLRIFFATFERASLWTVLPPRLPLGELAEMYIRLLASFNSPVTELWPSQIDALDLALGENSGAVINLRTSGGKTRVAELAILQSLIANPHSKVLYLAPFRSLAFEIEQSLGKTFSPLGFIVTHLYGGATINLSDFGLVESSHIIIATPEKAKALIRGGSGIETSINLIIIDEGHLLGSDTRNIRNEMFLTHIKEYASRKSERVILLSAVLPNAEDLAAWIADDSSLVAKSDWKPSLERLGLLQWDGQSVRLDWLSDEKPFNPRFVVKKPLGFGCRRREFPADKKEAVATTAVRLAQNGTVMIYVGQARMVKSYAKAVILALGETPADFEWDETLWAIFQNVCVEELGEGDVILDAARKGVICHNNKLPTLVRIAIERLMRSKAPTIIIATTTLGQGVNIGISTVIVAHPYYGQNKPLNCRDFWNICGRAGRAYSDSEGRILYALDTKRKQSQLNREKQLVHGYFGKKIECVESGVLAALKYIYDTAVSANVNFDTLIEAIANDDIAANIEKDKIESLKDIFDLLDDTLLAMHEDFCGEIDSLDWIDDVFRRSLAIIQAEADVKDRFVNILKARAKWLTNSVTEKAERHRLIATGVPFSVSRAIFNDVQLFKTIAENFIIRWNIDRENVTTIANCVKIIEDWVYKNARSLLNKGFPEQSDLETIREAWISGIDLTSITLINSNAGNIVKNFYEFTLPWVVHAISRFFDPEIDEEIFKAYTLLALLIELGLPNETAANVYMAGIRSRRVSIEISALDCIKDRNLTEIKEMLIIILASDIQLSDEARVWIDSLAQTYATHKLRSISFPPFRLNTKITTNKLYVRRNVEKLYLISQDGNFQVEVKSTEKLPFEDIANKYSLYFECSNDVWYLKTYNPLIQVTYEIA